MENDIILDLKQGLESAYVNGSLASNLEYKPSFISNNPYEGKKVIASVEDELAKCDKFQISVAFITMSGITPLLQTLKKLEESDVPGEILTTNYLDFSEPEALLKLNGFRNITIKMYDTMGAGKGFHTKGYIFRKNDLYRIILGSSNMTGSALTSNIEWNTKLISTEQGEIAADIVREFNDLWNSDYALDFDDFYEIYKARYEIINHQREIAKKDKLPSFEKYTLKPNSMQEEFIVNLRRILNDNKERALLISATGTGKTYASAFAVRELGFKRVLFIVHRAQLAIQAKRSYERVFDSSISMGLVGAGKHEYECDFIFAMVETLNKDEHLFKYSPEEFDCIILDEAHHSVANTYQKVMDYFKPRLFLGMTATPDKRDDHVAGRNVYELFDYQIAHEIRLKKAMEDNLLCPFHYFGISDLEVCTDSLSNKKNLSNKEFGLLTSDERVKHVIEQAEFYGYSGERVKGLIFCNKVKECEALSDKFNKLGYRTLALSGDSPQNIREDAFERLAMAEEDASQEKTPLDYIFSVDILNEGVDIVEVNQVIMLRPTQSPIIFIQQLGRGLRKAEGKEYVVILDFIGNYNNNFMIPVALSGDRTYNADVIRKYVISGNSTIPGASTIHFDEISKNKIFSSIDKLSHSTFKSLIKDGYVNLKNRLGRIPRLIDFYENDEVDPLIIIREYKTYYSFIEAMEKSESIFDLTEQEKLSLEYFSKTILSGVRPVELEVLRLLLNRQSISYSEIIDNCKKLYDYEITGEGLSSALKLIGGNFVSNKEEHARFCHIDIVNQDMLGYVSRTVSYFERLAHQEYREQLRDIVDVGLARYVDKYNLSNSSVNPFVLYEKYSRRDVCLLMNVGKDMSSTMFGMSRIGDDLFIFVTYHKEDVKDDVIEYRAGRPDYADEFVDNVTFRWDSQIDKKLNGDYMKSVLGAKRNHLLVQKTLAESNFFYMGEFDIVDVYESTKKNKDKVDKPICKLKFRMRTAVREDLLKYLQSNVNEKQEKVVK